MSNRFELYFHLAQTLDLTPAELLSLRWEDLEGIDLPAAIVQRHRDDQARDRLFFAHHYVDRGLVFADYHGGPVDQMHVLTHYVQPWLRRLEPQAYQRLRERGCRGVGVTAFELVPAGCPA